MTLGYDICCRCQAARGSFPRSSEHHGARWLAHRGAALSWTFSTPWAIRRGDGIKRIPDFNTGQRRHELFHVNRSAAALVVGARLPQARAEPPNLRLESTCWSTVSSSSRAAPSGALHSEARSSRPAPRRVILSQLDRLGAGAASLRIGPATGYPLGIDIVMDKPGIGRNLQDHLSSARSTRSRVRTLNETY